MRMERLRLPWCAIAVLALLASEAQPAGAATLPGAEPLRTAILDLVRCCGDHYLQGREYLSRLEQLERRAEQLPDRQAAQLSLQLEALRREALLANPLVRGRPILFVARHQYRPDHHNTETMFQTGEINTGSFQGPGALKVLDLARGGRVRTVIEVPDGVARDPEVSFDGRKILFAMRRNRQDDYHIYQINADGSGLEQLTFGSGLSDIDPIWLPSGEIVFTSTREPKYCMCNRHIMGNLFKMDADGANLQQIGHNTLHEGHPSLLPDGRILYDRWEYVDRNFGNAQGLWTVNPDGTNHVVYYGNSTDSPGAVLDARAIPGTQQVVATFSSCHDRPWGALAILDRRLGVDGRPAVIRTWPADAIGLVDHGNYDTFTRVRPKYEDPYPLSAKHFLCSRMTGKGEQMGIYLVDMFGNEVLVHAEELGCFDPMPLAPRERPPAIPPRIELARREGHFYVADVYVGTGMEKIARGTVRSLRVVESPEKRFWTHPAWDGGTGQQAPGMAWDDFNNKRILGTVPVEPDGSAYFGVPADRFVYFQLLDERGMMVQTMRSGTIVRPGETTGCVGCHDQRRAALGVSRLPAAMRRPPSRLAPRYGPERLFNYLAEVQPVLDKHCVSCHDYGKDSGKKLNLAGDLGLVFNTSYVELRAKNYVHVIGAGPAPVLPPLAWGSHTSPLVKILLEGHKDPKIDSQVKLGKEDFDRIVTWIDLNAPYYPDYSTSYRENLYGRSPLDNRQLAELSRLSGLKLQELRYLGFVNFTRPEHSPCLGKLADKNSPEYRQALTIIQAGRQTLKQRPRTDMPGFQLVSRTEIGQQSRYEARQKTAAQMREAILKGQKFYDRPAGGQ